MAIDLYSRKDSKCNDYIQMSLKGYRHLVGIFLDKEINKINDGILIEKIIKLIVSKGKIITDENLTDFSNLNITKIETNLISIEKYLNSSNNSDLLTEGFIDTDYLERIIICMNIYNEINPKESSNIINDLYYAFARNNIKIVRINKDTPNKIKLINEAISYSNLYKENETNKKSKKWIRFKSLMNEINIAKASQNNIINTINEIQDTILQCTTRTDLYFRNSTLLVYAITLQYELTVKNNLSLNKSQKRDKIKQLESFISKVRMDIKKIDIVSDIEFENTLKIARKYFKKELTLVKQLAK
ncbi:MAG: hypothetical protein IPN60_08690 [Saprospiraceae bacterium]|nr:hypothetical protein [Candidatus Opimibacter skivensis]